MHSCDRTVWIPPDLIHSTLISIDRLRGLYRGPIFYLCQVCTLISLCLLQNQCRFLIYFLHLPLCFIYLFFLLVSDLPFGPQCWLRSRRSPWGGRARLKPKNLGERPEECWRRRESLLWSRFEPQRWQVWTLISYFWSDPHISVWFHYLNLQIPLKYDPKQSLDDFILNDSIQFLWLQLNDRRCSLYLWSFCSFYFFSYFYLCSIFFVILLIFFFKDLVISHVQYSKFPICSKYLWVLQLFVKFYFSAPLSL